MIQTAGLRVQVRDHALWIRHIDGSASVQAWLESVPAGAMVRLEVDGVTSDWGKMADGKDGRAPQGFKPMTEPGRSKWHELQSSRSEFVSFSVASDD